ncbi:hypothetical protein BC943DRAFT_364045 [Umbelopsis sp. AD052]|nr:hypothetical protein BC943DRAFT_364045 [Umbelopsis sp. AD052]
MAQPETASYTSASQCLAQSENEYVKIEHSKDRGRYFIAKTDVPAGTVVLKSYPYATAIFDTQRKRVCAHCIYVHPTKSFSLHCKQCDQVYFCSQQCHDEYLGSGTAQNVNHQRICAPLRKLATLKADKHMKSVTKMILHLFWERARSECGVHWSRSQEQWWEVGETDITRGLEDLNLRKDIAPVESNFDMVLALESHYHRWTTDDCQSWKRLYAFLHTSLTECALLKESDDMDFIMHLISRVESNGFGMYWAKPSKKRDQDPFGRALFPHAAFFNHDCDRNCEATQLIGDDGTSEVEEPADIPVAEEQPLELNGEPGQEQQPKPVPSVFEFPRGAFRLMLVRTLCVAQAEKPLCISYIDWDQPVAARRRKLLEEYFFECMCERCVKESQAKPKTKKSSNKRHVTVSKTNKPARIDGL